MTAQSSSSAPDPGVPSDSIGAALRRITHAVHRTVLDEGARQRVQELLLEAEAAVSGEPYVRWYEEATPDGMRRFGERFREYSLFRGVENPAAPPMDVREETLADGRPAMVGEVIVDRLYEGPPRTVHGGYVAGLFDDLLGSCMRFAEVRSAVTGRLTVKYRKPTPIEVPLRFEAWLDDDRGKLTFAKARCLADDVLTAEAEAMFVRTDLTRLGLDER